MTRSHLYIYAIQESVSTQINTHKHIYTVCKSDNLSNTQQNNNYKIVFKKKIPQKNILLLI